MKPLLSTNFNVEVIRQSSTYWTAATILSKFPELKHSEHTIKGHAANEKGVTLSVFAPKSPTNRLLPAIYFVHGGGQVGCNRFCALDFAIEWLDGIEFVFVSVEYRLAPEHPAPAALYDSYAGLVWVADNSQEIVGGSGGAPIAVGSALLARDNKYPPVCAQMLFAPMLDDRVNTVSAKQFENRGPWCGHVNRMAWDCVLGDKRGGPSVDGKIAPARESNLSGLPPTYIDVSNCEVFRDEAVEFASRLWELGGSAELHVWPGGFHGFEMAAPDAPVSRAAINARNSWIRRILHVSL
jgi:acetyl esterase/lipase